MNLYTYCKVNNLEDSKHPNACAHTSHIEIFAMKSSKIFQVVKKVASAINGKFVKFYLRSNNVENMG